MWQSPSQGLILMGGMRSTGTEDTTEKLQDDGSSVVGWKLRHKTEYGDITNIASIKCYNIVTGVHVALDLV